MVSATGTSFYARNAKVGKGRTVLKLANWFLSIINMYIKFVHGIHLFIGCSTRQNRFRCHKENLIIYVWGFIIDKMYYWNIIQPIMCINISIVYLNILQYFLVIHLYSLWILLENHIRITLTITYILFMIQWM